MEEAVRLLEGLGKAGRLVRTAKPPRPEKAPRRSPRPRPRPAPPAVTEPVEEPSLEQLPYRADRIQHMLGAMCRRAGFSGAVLADREGLPLAAYHSPASIEAASACSSVLGDAMTRTAGLLEQSQVNHISMTVNETEKICLHAFVVNGLTCHLMVLAPQEVNEREEMAQCVTQLCQMMTSPAS